MSNFICVNGSLRFDPSSVTFCTNLLQPACLSKAYLRAGVLAPNARHFVACATCLGRLGDGAMPHCDRSGLRWQNRHHPVGLLLRCQSRERLRRPWMSGMPGARSRPLAGKTSRRWVPYCGFDPSRPFCTLRFGAEPRQPTVDAREPGEPPVAATRPMHSFHLPEYHYGRATPLCCHRLLWRLKSDRRNGRTELFQAPAQASRRGRSRGGPR